MRYLLGSLAALVLLALLGALVPLAFTPHHAWRTPAAFDGERLCNPYQDLGPKWLKANFHAHSNVREGSHPPCAVIARYHAAGFDLAQVSDHMALTDTSSCNPGFIPTYEHGANLQEVHFTAIGANRTLSERYPLLQLTPQKQHTIDRLKGVAEYVVINHPWKPIGFSLAEMARLDGYDAIEVQGMGSGKIGRWWDVALTSGYPAWCFTGDDAHFPDRPFFGTRFTWLNVTSTDREAVLADLKAGRFFCGSRKDEGADEVVFPTAVVASGGAVSLTLSAPARKLRWIGAGGKVLAAENEVSRSRQSLGEEPYLRVEIETSGEDLFLNPVRRCR